MVERIYSSMLSKPQRWMELKGQLHSQVSLFQKDFQSTIGELAESSHRDHGRFEEEISCLCRQLKF